MNLSSRGQTPESPGKCIQWDQTEKRFLPDLVGTRRQIGEEVFEWTRSSIALKKYIVNK
jgi:hypothetical protein